MDFMPVLYGLGVFVAICVILLGLLWIAGGIDG